MSVAGKNTLCKMCATIVTQKITKRNYFELTSRALYTGHTHEQKRPQHALQVVDVVQIICAERTRLLCLRVVFAGDNPNVWSSNTCNYLRTCANSFALFRVFNNFRAVVHFLRYDSHVMFSVQPPATNPDV